MHQLQKSILTFTRNLFFTVVVLLLTLTVEAQQGGGQSAFGETMRSNGRIWVVIAVMVTILLGLILYLVRLDRKISRIEKDHA